MTTLCTVRTRNAELWLINNKALEEECLMRLAKYCDDYTVKPYAFAIEGNHLHNLSRYENSNQASFNRDLNSTIAKAVERHQPNYKGGRLWGRRYSSEFVPDPEDIEEYFFYLALQPIKDGLVDRLSDYPGYNCFSDAISGRIRIFNVVDWTKYNDLKRYNPDLKIKDFTRKVSLKYERLPGYEGLSSKEYRALMLEKYEERRVEILKKRKSVALGRDALLRKKPGHGAINSKKSSRFSHRPRVLSINPNTRHRVLKWYFSIYFEFKEASRRFLEGDLLAEFPPGTYRPPKWCVVGEAELYM